MPRIKIEPAHPYSDRAAYGSDKYTAQNILYLQVNFPEYAQEGDEIHSIYSDRDWGAWETAAAAHLPKRPLQFSDPESFLKFAAAFVGHPIDGARAVRFSNQGGFEIFRIDTWKKGANNPTPPTYDGMDGPNVIRPKRDPMGYNGRYDPRLRFWADDIDF